MDKKLVEIFDYLLGKHFPKGECKERGHALLLVSEAMYQIEHEWLPDKIKMKDYRNNN